jgi:hypothetical protein
MGESMQVEFDFTRDDYIAYARHASLTGEAGQKWTTARRRFREWLAATVLASFAYVVVFVLFVVYRDPTTDPKFVVVLACGAGLAGQWWHMSQVHKAVKPAEFERRLVESADSEPGRAYQGFARVTIMPSGILWESNRAAWFSRWNGIRVLDSGGELLLIHLHGQSALPIPMRAFASADEGKRFLELAREFHKADPPSEETELRDFLGSRDVACPQCGYNLRGAPANTCPECGGEFTLERLLISQSANRKQR